MLYIFIGTVIFSYLISIWRRESQLIDLLMCIYVQSGLIYAYIKGGLFLLIEPFELPDVTHHIVWLSLLIWFGIINSDILDRWKIFWAGKNRIEVIKSVYRQYRLILKLKLLGKDK